MGIRRQRESHTRTEILPQYNHQNHRIGIN